MNLGNDNAESACANLELSLGYSNHCISSRSSGQGAGVNATASRVDMTFVTSCPLAELVWCPHNGLSLKCADCSFVAKSTPTILDVGPSKFVNTGNLVKSQGSLAVNPRNIGGKPNIENFTGKSGDMEEVNSMGKALVVDDNQKESTSKNEGRSQENDKDVKNHKTMDFFSSETNEPLLHENKDLSMPIPIPRSSSPEGRNKDYIFDIESKIEAKVDCFTSVLPLERFEFTAENELPLEKNDLRVHEDRLLRGKSVQIETSPTLSKTLLNKDKGKGKILSEGDACKIVSKEGDDSSESVESCSNVGLAVGKKRERFEKNFILESKRVKNKIQENPILTSLGSQPSSFMNWISNMVKVSNRLNEKEEPSLTLALTNSKECHVSEDKNIVPYNGEYARHGDVDMGFRTYFQSIYSSKQKEMETKKTIGESKELVLAERVVGPSATPISCHGYLACADVADGRNSSSAETRVGEKIINDMDNKVDNKGSLWINRFARKSHEHLVNLDGPSFASKKDDDKSNEISTLVSNNLKNKGVMASVFAKRIDALKQIASSDAKLITCFYCGKIGHDLRNCSEITETDKDYFIRNISSNVGIEESHYCLCISCFQHGHWAISCPKSHMFKQKSPSQLHIIGMASTLSDDAAKGEKLTETPKGMFDIIRKLRLSRTDILRWMNSHSSLSSLEGYFLRLRLGKLEKGTCGTGYYAARVTGEQKEKQLQGSKGPIAVDIGGKSFLVESQHISNQDFLEDELTEWWLTMVKSGTAIPSGDELILKLEEKIRLGF